MKNKNVELIRLEESDDGTFGVLMIEGKVFCCTLEPPDLDNARNISNIPPGRYYCHRYASVKYGVTFGIANVTGRSGILFHKGNVVEHTKGCIILGQYFGKLRGDRAVLNSGNTFKTFMKIMKGEYSFNLNIREIDRDGENTEAKEKASEIRNHANKILSLL